MELTTLNVFENIDEVKKVWNYFSPSFISYFQTWEWIENWVQSLPMDLSLDFNVIYNNNVPILAFFTGWNKKCRNHIIPSHGIHLNTTGHDEYDRPLWVEYNFIPTATKKPIDLNDLLSSIPNKWDEFFLPCIDMNHFPGNQLKSIDSTKFKAITLIEQPSYFVDLNKVRQSEGELLPLLRPNTRSQIKRSYKTYIESEGKIKTECANSLNDALEMFDKLLLIHRNTYNSKSLTSTFDTEYSKKFHLSLLKSQFASGNIQLIKVSTEKKTLGILYNLIFKNKVFFFQSGLSTPQNNRQRPGMICHNEAIKLNAKKGFETYDFLAGVERYKSSLSTNSNSLAWIKIQKPKIKFCIEAGLKKLIKKNASS